MPNPLPETTSFAARLIEVAHRLAHGLSQANRITRTSLNEAMYAAFGATAASGAWTQRDSFIAAEIALILFLRETTLPVGAADTVAMLGGMAGLLPTQTVRSEDQVALQHFSTPLALSWLVARMAAIAADDNVLEPSAGTGMLAAWAGEGSALHLNEIDETRADILRLLFPSASVTREDGTKVSQLGIQPSVIVMNPPFARNAAGGEDKLAAARHIAAAVAALRPGGRLVAIMPDSFSAQGRAGEVFARALQGCRVAAHLRVDGAFKSHGTSVAVRLLAIDKASGQLSTTVVQRASLLELLPFVEQMPTRLPLGLATTGAARSDDVDNYIRYCVFYDLLFSNTQLSTIANSTNVWSALASTNVALQTNVMPLDGDGNNTAPGHLESCQQAYQDITSYWTSYLNNYSFRIAGMTFPFLSSNQQQSNQYAQAKLMSDLPSIYSSVTNNSASATDILQQALATNAFIAARANAAGSPNTSSTDAFAQARADVQAGYTYNTIADGARKWVPILNIVLTAVFYAMFPVIFPLFLLPETGLTVLKGYFTGFFYLAAWGPLYAVLNMMTVTRFTTSGLAAASGGMTLSNAAALQAVSGDVAEVAGYMLAFVPFIAAGMARGATAIGSSATSFLAPSQNAAEAAAGEAATGNYSYGNVNFQNMQAQNTSTFQRQIAPTLTTGAPRVTEIGRDGSVSQHYPDRDVYDYTPSFSRYPTSVSLGESLAERSDREAKVLSNEAADLSHFQRQVQDWSSSRVKAHGGSNTSVQGNSNTTSDGQRTTDSAFHGDLTANTNANSTDKVTTEFDNRDQRYTASGTGSASLFLGKGGSNPTGANAGSPSSGTGP